MLQYILSVSDASRELGYDVLFVNDADGAAAVRRITSSNQVDGVVLLDVTHADPRLARLRQARQPGALIGLPGDSEGLDVFDLDFGESARVLVDHLYGLGHREMILVTRPSTSSSAAEPTAGGSATRRSSARRATGSASTPTTASRSSRRSG